MSYLKLFKKIFLFLESNIQETYNNNLFTKFFAGWAFLTFLVSFDSFMGQGLLSNKSSFPCFPIFQNCKELFNFIDLSPAFYGYSESIFFTLLFCLIVLGAYFLYVRKFFYTHLIILVLFIVKLIIFGTNYQMGNYDYYDLVLIFVFLLYPSRLDFTKLTFIILYFLSSTIKIHEGWIIGTYFSSLYYGLPLIPHSLIPTATNIIILSQILGGWFLLSKNKKISDYALYFFIFFHLYSTVLVGYRYPITSVLSIMVIFVIKNNTENIKDFYITLKTAPFYLFITILFLLQSIQWVIPGDVKLTLEGNHYGLYMFDANHQCISYVNSKQKDELIVSSFNSKNRCDPYRYLYGIKQKYCHKNTNKKISWIFDHSINGEPFRRIVDTEDVCSLTYKPFSHNDWIGNEYNSPIVGLVYKNIILGEPRLDDSVIHKDDYIYAPTLSNSKPVSKTDFQIFIEKKVREIKFFYWTLWFGILIYVLSVLIRNTLKVRKTKNIVTIKN